MKRKWLAIGIFLLFIGTCIIPALAQDTEKTLPESRGSWLYVGGSGPGNYTRIQDAINASDDGDTVFIYDDSSPYYETLYINTSIIVRGENWNTTVLNGNGCQSLVHLNVPSITVQDLTFENCRKGVVSQETNHITILHNNFIGMTGDGVQLWWSHNNTIAYNCFKRIQNNAVYLIGGSIETIFGNFLEGNGYGIVSDDHSVIRDNTVKNTSGYSLVCADNNLVENNFFENNSGVYLTSENIIVRNNTLIKDGFFVDWNFIQFSNNTVNGKPIIYSYEPVNQIFDQPAGQILIVYGHNCTVRNVNFSDTAYGLILQGNWCTIENITTQDDNAYGIYVSGLDTIIKSCSVTQSRNGISVIGKIDMINCTIMHVQEVGIKAWYDDSHIRYCTITDAGQIGIYAAGNNMIIDHCTIKNSTHGLAVKIANNMTIEYCSIENSSEQGILINGSNNQISYNSLKNNGLGIDWNGFCSVNHNNFMGNEQSAKYHLEYGHLLKTQWVDNYWELPQSKPKIIFGKSDILLFRFGYFKVIFTIPFFGIDFSPAQAPHPSC